MNHVKNESFGEEIRKTYQLCWDTFSLKATIWINVSNWKAMLKIENSSAFIFILFFNLNQIEKLGKASK